MTAEVWVAIVTTIGIVVVALISNRGRQHAKAARAQVENSHDLNFRDDIDNKHVANVNRLKAIDHLVTWQGEHQIKSERGFRRIVRLEILVLGLPVLAATAAGLYSQIRRRTK